MYIKILGGIFLMASAAAVGFLKADELKERINRLSELKRMMVLLQGELRFHRAVLSEAFENVSEHMNVPFSVCLKEMSRKLEKRDSGDFCTVWSEMSEILLKEAGFEKKDREILDTLGSSLGYLDLTMQTETLNLAILQADEAIKHAKEQFAEKGKLYQTMGVTVGALLVLLII